VLHVVIDGAVWIGCLEQQWPSLLHLGINGSEHLADQSKVIA